MRFYSNPSTSTENSVFIPELGQSRISFKLLYIKRIEIIGQYSLIGLATS